MGMVKTSKMNYRFEHFRVLTIYHVLFVVEHLNNILPVLSLCVCFFSEGDWDFYWCDREWLHANYDTMFLQEHQKILHFRNHYEVTNLDSLP